MTTPNHQIPNGSISGYGSWGDVQSKTQSDWKAEQTGQWEDSFSPLGLFSGIIGGILSNITSLFGSTSAAHTAIQDLQDKTQKLEGVVGYGAAYMSGTYTPGTAMTKAPFNRQKGPNVGADFEESNNWWRLRSKGLWVITAQNFYDYLQITNGDVFLDIVIRRPDGSEFDRAAARGGTAAPVTLTNVYWCVVPAADYTVEVQCAVGTGYRTVLGGNGYSLLAVKKESSETT